MGRSLLLGTSYRAADDAARRAFWRSEVQRLRDEISELECDSVQTGVDGLLSQALNALAGVAMDVADAGVPEPAAGSSAGVA